MKKYKELLKEDEIIEITKEEALELLPKEAYNDLDDLWDSGHENNYSWDGIVEEEYAHILPKHIEVIKKELDAETRWVLKNNGGKIVLVGDNRIEGYGITEEIDVTKNYNQLDY